MTADFKTVFWKEWRETLLQYGNVRRWVLNTLMIVGLIGIFMPLQFGRTTVESLFLLMWMWLPLLNVVTLVADSIAGERERHTLETLLASRLPDRAIVSGKIAVAVVQAWMVMLAGALLALVTVNLLKGEGSLILYPPAVAFGIAVLPLLAGTLVAGIGVAVSAHAATARQAYQRMAIPLAAVVIIPSLGLSVLPSDVLASFYSAEYAQSSLGGVVVMVALALLLLDVLVIGFALARFRRSRLIVG